MSNTIDIIVPESVTGTSGKDAVISAWLYEDGAQVSEGAVVAQIMVEKVEFELDAPASGRLEILVRAEEGTLTAGQMIGRLHGA
jgi:pyruvate/2-oxoglutarate dehydrogenase complex dihydrolipoamide acyltransferase (E2) component